MSARQVVTFGSCCQSSTFGGFWDLCNFSDQILASSQSSTFGGFWDLDKIWSEKLHLFAQRISDVAYSVCSKCSSPSLGCLRALEPGMSEKCPKSVRNLVRKVTSFRQILDIQPKSNLQPSGLLSADHTHNLAVYSNLAAFGQAESLNWGRVQNVLRPKIGLNRGPKWEK